MTVILAFIVFARFRSRSLLLLITDTRKLCKETIRPKLEADDDLQLELDELIDEEMPLFDDWGFWLQKVNAAIDSLFLVNIIALPLIFGGQFFEETPYILNTIVAFCDAGVVIAWLDIREKQKYIEGLREHYYEILHPKEIESDIL